MDLVYRGSIIQRTDARVFLAGVLENGLQECEDLSFGGSVNSRSRRSKSSLTMMTLALRFAKRWEILPQRHNVAPQKIRSCRPNKPDDLGRRNLKMRADSCCRSLRHFKT